MFHDVWIFTHIHPQNSSILWVNSPDVEQTLCQLPMRWLYYFLDLLSRWCIYMCVCVFSHWVVLHTWGIYWEYELLFWGGLKQIQVYNDGIIRIWSRGRNIIYIYIKIHMVTTFRYLEGGPDHKASEVVWNTSSIMIIFKCIFNIYWVPCV